MKFTLKIIGAGGASLFAAINLTAAPFVVTNTNDSGPGTLRQAIIDANANFEEDQINFLIPGSGVHTIHLASPLPKVSRVTIDGYTQPGAKPNTLATGTDAVLLIEVDGSSLPSNTATIECGFGPFGSSGLATIRGLVINGDVRIVGTSANRVVGCYFGTNAAGTARAGLRGAVGISGASASANTVGGTTPADRNVIALGVGISGDVYPRPGGAAFQGNYIGVSADGQTILNPTATATCFQSDNNLIGGPTAAAGNVIAGSVSLGNASSNLVQNNRIGTDASGMVASLGAGGMVLVVGTSPGNQGQTMNNSILQNVIVNTSPSSRATITVLGGTSNTFVANFVGVGADGKTRVAPRSQGIRFERFAANNSIGGVNAGDGNVIVFDGANQPTTGPQPAAGIIDISGQARNFINGNSISGPGGLGIDLAATGVTPNDPGDQDMIQNYPVLASAAFANGNVRVTGSLNSLSNTSFRIELFGSDTADPSGYGQGEFYLGFANVTTDANGNASFDVTLPVPPSVRSVSSTATGPTGTSEFSAAIFTKLLNISTRADVNTGDNATIGGFIITGTNAKRVLLRGIGPSLPLAGKLGNPVLDLFDASITLLAQNNDWKASQQADIEMTGLAPSHDLESALLMTLPPAAYTVRLRGEDGTAGIGVVEVYDLTPLGSQLANISTRGLVGPGDKTMIGGFIASSSNRPIHVVVRAMGPSLGDAGINNPLPDPLLQLHNSDGAIVAANDNWKEGQEAGLRALNLAPAYDVESGIAINLQPGAYTAVLRGKNQSTGVALVEVYQLP